MLSKHSNKHTFLSEATSPHTITLLLNLIYKDIVKKSDLLLIIYGAVSSNKSIEDTCRAHGIDVLKWNSIKESSLKFLTLNSLSLQPTTAKIIKYCMENNFVSADKVAILITDDEVDRWTKLYNDVGCLKSDSSALIDENVLRVLNKVDTYVISYNFWGKKLEEIIGRKLNIVDAILPFGILDFDSQAILEEFLDRRMQYNNKSHYKIMLFTKPHNLKDTLEWFFSIASYLIESKNISPDKSITLSVWFNSNFKGFFLYKTLVLLTKFKQKSMTIELKKTVPHSQYFLMLYDHDCLILQGRGGFSTAKYFAEKIGKIITLTNTPNDQVFKKEYGIETFNYKSKKDALRNAIASIDCDESKKIDDYTRLITKRHDISFKIVKEYWDKFLN